MDSAGRKAYILMLICVTLMGCIQNEGKTDDNKEATFNLCPDCNVLLITIDALRADHMGCYGFVRNTSPRMDEFCGESIVFEQAVSAWPKTTPGLGTILTGKYGRAIDMMYSTYDPLPEYVLTIPEILKKKGYATGAFPANANLHKTKGWPQGFDEYCETWMERDGDRPNNVNRKAIEFIKNNSEGPFFTWIHYIDPHTKYRAAEKSFKYKFINDPYYNELLYDDDKSIQLPVQEPPEYQWFTTGVNGIPLEAVVEDEDDIRFYIAEYDAEITYTDHYLGELIDFIKQSGLWDNTIIIVSADHGESLGDHDWYFDHGRYAYDASSRIPLMVYVPGLTPMRVSHPVSTIDYAPTILDLVGLEPVKDMQGVSLVPVLTGETEKVREYVFNEAGYVRDHQRAVWDGRWKLMYIPSRQAQLDMRGVEFELYDLSVDPLETKNLASDYPEVVDRLSNELFVWMRETLPQLEGYEMKNKKTFKHGTIVDWDSIEVSGGKFYVKAVSSGIDRDYCFALPSPNPDAKIVLELVESNSLDNPFNHQKNIRWDDDRLDNNCIKDAWGCLLVNGEKISELPYTVRLGDLGEDNNEHYLNLWRENDKSFCFNGGQFNKRVEESDLGYVVEVMGHVEEEKDAFHDLDEASRNKLRDLGYLT